MKFDLTHEEAQLLKNKNIRFDGAKNYTDDEALNLLDQVREIEDSYAQFTGGEEEKLYFQYGALADKIFSQIPEE